MCKVSGNLLTFFTSVVFSLTLTVATVHADENRINFGGDFSLTDLDNQQFELKQLRGKVVLLLFGFTYCPNMCPTELSKVARAIKSIKDKQHLVQGLFVSIDPERDSPEKLKTYINYFSPDMIGLTGTHEQIQRVTEQYKVEVKINKSSETDRYYDIDHTLKLYVINQSGKLINLIPYGIPSSHVAAIIEKVLADQS